MNDNNPEGLTKLFDFENELYKGIDKTKNKQKLQIFFKKIKLRLYLNVV